MNSSEPRSPSHGQTPSPAEQENKLREQLATAPASEKDGLFAQLWDALAAQNKPADAEVEAGMARYHLQAHPERNDLAFRLWRIGEETGTPVDDQIEYQATCHIVSENLKRQLRHIESANRKGKRTPECDDILMRHSASRHSLGKRAHEQFQAGRAPRSVYFFSLPKSGTVFLNQALIATTGYKLLELGSGYFPRDFVPMQTMQRLAVRPFIAMGHLDGSPENVLRLSACTDRVIVHVRDPRSSALSWLHHYNKLRRRQPWKLNYLFPCPDDAYFALDERGQMDWLIENYFTAAIGWIEQWVAVEQAGGKLAVKLMTFDDFTADEAGAVQSILSHFGLEYGRDAIKLPAKAAKTHFRKGMKDEWRTALTADQLERMRAMIPPALAERFGWPLD